MFTDIARGVNDFIDALKANVDFDSFTNMFSKIINILSNNNTKIFDTLKNVIESIFNIIKPIMGVLTPLFVEASNFVVDILPKAIDFLYQLSERIKSFTESLIPSSDTISGLQTLFKGVFDILSAIGQVLGTVFLSLWDSLGQILRNLLPDGKEFGDILTTIGTKLTEFADKIKGLVDGKDGVPKLSELMGSITDKFIKFMDTFKNLNLLETFVGLIKRIGDGIKLALGGTEDMSLLDTITEKIKGFLQGIKDILSDEHGQLDMVKVFEAGGIAAVFKKLFDFIKDFKERTNDLKGIFGFIDDFKEIFESLAKSFEDWTKAQNLKFVATAMLEMAGAMFVLSMIDPVALGKATIAMAGMFNMIERVLVILSSLDKGKVAAGAAAIASIGTAMLEMSAAIAIMGNMDLDDLAKGLLSVALMMQMMVKVVQELTSIQGEMPKVVGTLIGLAIALNLLVLPIELLGRMDLLDLAKGLGAVAIMMYGMVTAVGTLAKTTKESDLIGTGFAMIEMAIGINLLASAVTKVADLSWEQIGKGLAVMAAGLVAMVGAAKVVDAANLTDELVAVGGSLIMLGVAMVLMSTAAQGIANVSWEDLGKMAAVLAGALIALGVASALINGPNLFLIASAILMVAEAIALLTTTLLAAEVIGPIAMGLGAALNGIKDSLVNFANNAAASAFLDFLQNLILFIPKLAVGIAQGIIEMVVTLGNGIGQIVDAVVKIGSAVIGGLRELLPQIFDLVRETLEQVFQLLIDETPRLFEALSVFFQQLWPFLGEQLHGFFGFLTTYFTELLTFLQTEGPMLVETIRLMIDTVLQAIITEAPRFGETFLALLGTILNVIQTSVPQIAETLLSLLSNLLQQLAAYIPQIADSAMQIILGFLKAVSDNIGSIVESAFSIAIAFMQGLTEKMPEIVDTAFKMVIGFIDGLASAIEENHQALFEAIGHLIKAIVDALIDGITMIAKGAADLISGFLAEFDPVKLGQSLLDAGANLVKGIINGVVDWAGHLWDEVGKMAQGAIDTITGVFEEHSPSRAGYRAGAYLAEGVALGIDDSSDLAISSAGAMATGVLGALDDLELEMDTKDLSPSINASYRSSVTSDMDTSPTITPVVDDSSIAKGIDALNAVVASLPEQITTNLNAQISVDNNIYRMLEVIKTNIQSIDSIQGKMNTNFGSLLDGINSNTTEVVGWISKNPGVYIDSGTLVGAIAPAMDNALGGRQTLVGRGVL